MNTLKSRVIEHVFLDSRIRRLEEEIRSQFYSASPSIYQKILDALASIFCEQMQFQSEALGKSILSYFWNSSANLDDLLDKKQKYFSLLKSVIEQKSLWQWRSLQNYICLLMLGVIPSLLFGVWWKLYEKYLTPAVSPQKQDDVSLLEAGKSPHLGSNPKENEGWTYLSFLKSAIKQKATWLRQSLQNQLSGLGGISSLLVGVWRKLCRKSSTPAVSPQNQDDVSLLEAGKSPLLTSSKDLEAGRSVDLSEDVAQTIVSCSTEKDQEAGRSVDLSEDVAQTIVSCFTEKDQEAGRSVDISKNENTAEDSSSEERGQKAGGSLGTSPAGSTFSNSSPTELGQSSGSVYLPSTQVSSDSSSGVTLVTSSSLPTCSDESTTLQESKCMGTSGSLYLPQTEKESESSESGK